MKEGDVPDELEKLSDISQVTGDEESIVVNRGNLQPSFDVLEMYFGDLHDAGYHQGKKFPVELAEMGWLNYHRKRDLKRRDEFVVYTPFNVEDMERKTVGYNLEVIFGKSHSSSEDVYNSSDLVPIEFRDGFQYKHFSPFMPTHKVYREELGNLADRILDDE